MQAENGLGGERLKSEIEFVEKSIGALSESDYKLMTAVFIDKVPVSKAAKSLFCDRGTVHRRINRLINQMAEVYARMFLN